MTVQSRLQTELNVGNPPHLLEQFKPHSFTVYELDNGLI